MKNPLHSEKVRKEFKETAELYNAHKVQFTVPACTNPANYAKAIAIFYTEEEALEFASDLEYLTYTATDEGETLANCVYDGTVQTQENTVTLTLLD